MNPELRAHLARIEAAPTGPKVGAFFDYDGTVISGFSASAFYAKRVRDREAGAGELLRTLWAATKGVHSDRDFAALLDVSIGGWAGRTEDELLAVGEELFRTEIAGRLHPEAWELVAAHQKRGHTVVLASSATRFQVEPMARELGADHVLCTACEVRAGVLTGRPEGPLLWGVGKARAARALAEATGAELADCFAYSNGDEDVPLLASVGYPTAVAPDEALAAEAARRGWPVLDCAARDGVVGQVLRTAGFYGGFAAALATGLGVGLLGRPRDQVLEIAGGVGADVALALAGVEVRVRQGAEHLWGARPCVFVFNHQSNLDTVVVMKLLRTGYTGVAKKEARDMPGFGQLFAYAGVAFVDRGNTAQARKALEPAVAKVRDEGISLALAPEGTRSLTPRLGPFKKGAFHIAMQAGVPMVPVVLRGTGEVQWRGSRTLRGGTVEVVVLPPVDTSGWSAATIDEHVTAVRDRFVHTLAHWPEGSP